MLTIIFIVLNIQKRLLPERIRCPFPPSYFPATVVLIFLLSIEIVCVSYFLLCFRPANETSSLTPSIA